MPRIVVKSAQPDERPGKDGKVIRSQMAEIDLGNGYALPFRVGLGNRPSYPVGVYDIDPKCFTLSQYGDLQLSRYVDLIAVADAPSKKAA